MLLVSLIIAVVTCLTAKFLIEKWKLYQIKVPAPNTYPFIIEFFYVIIHLSVGDYLARLNFMNKFSYKFDEMVKFWFGTSLAVLLTHPKHVHTVLNSNMCLEKWSLYYDAIERDGGLIFGSVKKNWKVHRKILNHVFGASYLNSYKPIYESNAKRLCNKLDQFGKDEFDFFKYVRPISLNIVLESSTGRDYLNYEHIEELMDAVRM